MIKKKIKTRIIFPDIIYNNVDVEKFINIIMKDGKKTIARNIIYKSFNYIKKHFKKDPIHIFSLALDNAAPIIESKIKKIKGFNRDFFVELKENRRKSLSMRWIKNSSKIRKEKHMFLKLANELMDASKKIGETIKKKNLFHKIFNFKNKSFKNEKL